MITSNVYYRTFKLRYKNNLGTCFTLDVDSKQYLVTARHLVKRISRRDIVEVFYKNRWKKLEVILAGHCPNNVDIAVFGTNIQLSANPCVDPTSAGIILGQDIYFLGFPYNLRSDAGEAHRTFPLPLIKKGILSTTLTSKDGVERFYLDGHHNSGFSGGPVVFSTPGKADYKVAGVISGYRYETKPVRLGLFKTPLSYRCNTGIIMAYGIKHAIDVIKTNPVGYDLSRMREGILR